MKTLGAVISALVVAGLAFADAETHVFVRGVIEPNLKIDEVDLEFSEWQQSVPGGYVMRFTFDVDGNGATERFFASTLNADKLVCEWTVYSDPPGTRVGKPISLRPDGFWWNPQTKELLNYVRRGAEGGTATFSRIGKGGFAVRTEHVPLEEINRGLANQEPPRSGFRWLKPDVFIALLADIVSAKEPEWRSFNIDDAGNNYGLPNGRLLLSEDKSRVAEFQGFTPRSAFEALRKLDSLREETHEKQRSQAAIEPLPATQLPTTTTQGPESKPSPSAETKSAPSGFPIVPVAVVVAVIVGIALYIFRRKST